MGALRDTALATSRLLTVEDWAELDEDVEGELIDGRLEEEELPSVLHEMVVAWLVSLLLSWTAPRGGFVLGSEAKVAIGRRRGRKPDLSVFVRKGARPRLLDSLVQVPPHLVVEVVSPRPKDARRDRVEKLRDYATLGARYYWIVDPQLRSLEVLELDARRRRYVHVLDATGGRLERIPGCVGLALDLDALWARIDDVAGKPADRASGKDRRARSGRR